jgi:hypothetical protein
LCVHKKITIQSEEHQQLSHKQGTAKSNICTLQKGCTQTVSVVNFTLSFPPIRASLHMSQEIRRRTAGSTTVMQSTSNNNNEDAQESFLSSRNGAGLSATAMMKASPSQSGIAIKLHVPLLFSILPTFIQRIISSIGLFRCIAPAWKERFLIQIGGFLYKFGHDAAKTPKGTPFAIDSVDVHLVERDGESYDGSEFAIQNLPPSYQGVFVVSTLRKKHIYAVQTRDEALMWIHTLRQGRQEAITRSMGHANHMPYPQTWSYFDALAKTFIKSKERIKARIEETNTREMEMSSMGERGPAPRAYYG